MTNQNLVNLSVYEQVQVNNLLRNVTAEKVHQKEKLQLNSEKSENFQRNEIIVIERLSPSILKNLVDPNSIELLIDNDLSFAEDDSGNSSGFSLDITGVCDGNNNIEQRETKSMKLISENQNTEGKNLYNTCSNINLQIF